MKSRKTKTPTLIMLLTLLVFVACSNSTAPSSSEETIPSQSESKSPPSLSFPSSESNSSSLVDGAQSNVNIPDSVPEPPESQRSHASSPAPAANQTVIEPDATTVYIELSSNTITLDQISDSFQIPYTIYNESSKEVFLSPSYEIEKHNGAKWISFPFDELDQPNWPSVVFSIPVDGTIDANLSYWVFEEEFTLGTYRMVKQVGAEGKERRLFMRNFLLWNSISAYC